MNKYIADVHCFARVVCLLALSLISVAATAHEQPRIRVGGGTFGPEMKLVTPPGMTKIRVRIHDQSFTGAVPGETGNKLLAWKHWAMWAVHRWNEQGSVAPLLEWDPSPATCDTSPGALPNVNCRTQVGQMIIMMMPTSATVFAQAQPSCVDAFGNAQCGYMEFFRASPGSPPQTNIWSDRALVQGIAIPAVMLHEMGHAIGLDHSCIGAGSGEVGTICNCTAPGQRERRIMAGTPCGQFGWFTYLHGPAAEDIWNVRRANGQFLSGTYMTQEHRVSYDNGSTYSLQGDNFNSNATLAPSAVSVAGKSQYPGNFAIGWRSSPTVDTLSVMMGYTNGWDVPTRRTLVSASQRVRGAPAVALEHVSPTGNGLVVWTRAHYTDFGVSDARTVYGAGFNYDNMDSLTQSAFPASFSAVEPPALDYVRPVGSNGFWITAYVPGGLGVDAQACGNPPVPPCWNGQVDDTIVLRTGALNGLSPPVWSPPTPLLLWDSQVGGPRGIRTVAGVSISCDHSGAGANAGRCFLSYASSAGRNDETPPMPTEPMTLRTIGFTVNSGGAISNIQTWGFGFEGRTTGPTAISYNRIAGSAHLGWQTGDTNCQWISSSSTLGFWSSKSCKYTLPQRLKVTPNVMFSEYWNAIIVFNTRE